MYNKAGKVTFFVTEKQFFQWPGSI
jgi:hypothetical protein